jgi:putative glutamine amidotransferase
MTHISGANNRAAGWTPVIGVTASLKEDQESVAQRPLGRFVRADLDYVEGVAQAGGVPVVLPPLLADTRAAGAVLQGLDGLLLSGGSDLNPAYYGEEPLPELGITIPERDAFEMALLEQALVRGIPIFGICRGMQILNVALGGTLYQDLPSQIGGDILKHRQETPKWQPTHEVEVSEGSCVGEIVERRSVKVNSYHHQGIKELGEDLVVSARSADGVIEAVEAIEPGKRWVVGVQWHAEAMREAGAEHRNLFEAHVRAARHHARREAAA